MKDILKYMTEKLKDQDNRHAIIRMVKHVLMIFGDMFQPGRSKHDDKLRNNGKPLLNCIYSYRTYEKYINICAAFASWVAATHECYYLDAARNYVPEYLLMRINAGLSAWTIHLDASALAKLYQCSYLDLGVALPTRYRGQITRSHITHELLRWYEAKHPDLAKFCEACGLRRKEIRILRTEDIYIDDRGNVIVHVKRGKGGKERRVIALNDFPLQMRDIAIANGQTHIFSKIPSDAPIHIYRKLYAQSVYQLYARPVETLSPKQMYRCRADMEGYIFDKYAMFMVSCQLGHKRLSVVTTYLKDVFV